MNNVKEPQVLTGPEAWQLRQQLRAVQKKKKRRLFWLSLLRTVIVTLLLFGFVFRIVLVRGESMLQSYRPGDITFCHRLVWLIRPQRGDVVVAQEPSSESGYIIKRVIALPGDTVEVTASGVVRLNGAQLVEDYAILDATGSSPAVAAHTLGEDEYYLLGDNRANSKDSRELGPIPLDRIRGAVLFSLRGPWSSNWGSGGITLKTPGELWAEWFSKS